MLKLNSIKKNLGFQTAYQLLNTCLPLVTAPYLARVLGASKLGIFSFTSSIVSYFTLVAMLGTANYGTRCIASAKENREERSKTFWGIFSLQLILSCSALIAYIVYLVFFCKQNTLISSIQCIAIVSCIFNINWLFFGMENFKITVTRNFIIKILTVFAVLLVVKTRDDLWKYTLIMLSGTCISNLVLWFYMPRIVDFCKVGFHDIYRHLKPNLLLFVPLVAMSVYHQMDKTMLGILSTNEESGFYYNADKVINIPVNVISGVGTVMLPRISYLIQNDKRKEAHRLFLYSAEGVAFVSIAISMGIASVAKEFVPIFFGDGYDRCVILIMILAPVLVIKGFSLISRYLYLVPEKKEPVFIRSVFLGAFFNLVVNALLIPKLGAAGAAAGTVIAELAACVYQYRYISADIEVGSIFKNVICYILIGIVMFGTVRAVSLCRFLPITVRLAAEIVSGAAVFLLLSLLLWKKTGNKMAEQMFGNKLKRLHITI